jgi:hypothetical protein
MAWLARAGQARDPRRPDRPRHSARRLPVRQLADALRQPRSGEGAQGLGHRGAEARNYAAKLWDYWERNLDPDLFIDRSLAGRVKDKVVVVTGSSSGIGKATAIEARRRRREGDPGRARRREAPGNQAEIERAGGKALIYPRTSPTRRRATRWWRAC